MKLQGDKEKKQNIWYEFDKFSPPIGQGGMSVVYRGVMVHKDMGVIKDVAIKEIQPEGDVDVCKAIVDIAKREASIQLKHDNLLEMLGFVELEESLFNSTKKKYFVISEFLDCVSLDDVLHGKYYNYKGDVIEYAKNISERYRSAREETSYMIVKSVLSAITSLHDSGYIHRDIDPTNIVFTSDGKIKLIDFGLAITKHHISLDNDNISLEGKFVGKVEYSSPEQINGNIREQDFSTDIYSVGVLFFRLLSGVLPFNGNRVEIMQGHLSKKVPLHMIKGLKNSNYKKVISMSMQKKQNKRYSSAYEMRVAIDKTSPINMDLSMLISVVIIIIIVILSTPHPRPDDNDDVLDDPIDTNIISKQDYKDSLKVIDVSSVLSVNDINKLWDLHYKDINNPVTLYAISRYYNSTKVSQNSELYNKAKSYWEQTIVKNDIDIKYLKHRKNFTTKRFSHILVRIAQDNMEEYQVSDENFKQEFLEYVSSFNNLNI